jgi:hypothetical protein
VAAACLVTAASVGLVVFFFAAKQRTPFARALPFGEDPYDAVGSFGIQLAIVAAATSLLRGARRYGGGMPASQAALVLRGSVAALLAVFVTIQADAVALARHPGTWTHSPIGTALALGLVVVALTSLAGASLLGLVLRRVLQSSRTSAARAGLAVAPGILALAIYPEAWRRSGFFGAIGTAFYGTVVLFAETWALTLSIAPEGARPAQDLLDDVGAILGRRGAAPSAMTRWLRAGPWRFAVIVAVAGGAALAVSQAIGEGLPAGAARAVLVLGVFTGLEAAGILLGYLCFRKPLALIRDEGPS